MPTVLHLSSLEIILPILGTFSGLVGCQTQHNARYLVTGVRCDLPGSPHTPVFRHPDQACYFLVELQKSVNWPRANVAEAKESFGVWMAGAREDETVEMVSSNLQPFGLITIF